MYYSNEFSGKLRNLIRQSQQMDKLSYDMMDLRSYTVIMKKIITMSLEEKEYRVYFRAVYELIHYLYWKTIGDGLTGYVQEIIKNGEDYLKIGISKFPDDASNLKRYYIYCLEVICNFYINCYQVSDSKMNEFFDFYWEKIRIYSVEKNRERDFYEAKMKFECMQNNKEEAKKAFDIYQRIPINTDSCYVCTSRTDVEYFVFSDRLEKGLALIERFISRDIPTEYYDYEECDAVSYYYFYRRALLFSLEYNKKEYIKTMLPLYYNSIIEKGTDKLEDVITAVALAVHKDFDSLDAQLSACVEKIDEVGMLYPTKKIGIYLDLYAYFKLLAKHGVSNVTLNLQKPLFRQDTNEYNTLDLAMYFIEQSDKIGEKFAIGRPSYNYTGRKEAYEEMMNLS